jgi:hypothetical protein
MPTTEAPAPFASTDSTPRSSATGWSSVSYLSFVLLPQDFWLVVWLVMLTGPFQLLQVPIISTRTDSDHDPWFALRMLEDRPLHKYVVFSSGIFRLRQVSPFFLSFSSCLNIPIWISWGVSWGVLSLVREGFAFTASALPRTGLSLLG